jgi:cytochrome c-type biogenesis protein CcmE
VVQVVYHGQSPPPLFKVGRSVVVGGTYGAGRLMANDILTKCPSKYTAKPSAS